MTRAAAIGVACGLMASGSAPLTAPPALPSATPAMTAITVDLDADGHLDVATVVESGVAVALNDGRGGFHAPVVTPIRPLAGNGWFPRAAYLASGDVNGDGVLDLVQASMTDRCGADVLLGTGDGELVLGGRYEVIQDDSVGEQGLATNCSGLRVGDLDGDGRADVVLSHELYDSDLYFGYDVFLAEQDGSLAAPVRHPLAGISVATGADMNGDGTIDLVVAAAGCDRGCYSVATQIEVHLADGAGAFLPPRVFRFPLDHDGHPQGFAIGDLDGDAYPDVAAVTSSGCCTEDGQDGGPMRWVLHNDGSGNLVLGAAAPVLGAHTSMRLDVLDLADVDGDGDDDLLGVAQGLLWLEEAASPGHFLPPRLLARTPTDVVAPLAGHDVDGDGRADLVTSDALTGAPSVVDFQRFARGSLPLTLAPVAPLRSGVGDLNRDGRDDLVVPTPSGVTVLLGAAGGRFEARSIDGLESVAWLALADLDGDGALDLAGSREVHSGPASGLWVARGDGLGGFGSPRFIEAGVGTTQSGSTRLVVSDFEADGAPDLYLLHQEYDVGAEPSVERTLLSAFGNDGQGQLSLVAQLQVPREFVDLHAGDLDADGRGDALLAAYDQQLAWLPAPSASCAPALNVVPLPPAPVRRLIDVNADGADDLVTDSAVHLNDGQGRFGLPLGFVSEDLPPFFQTWPVIDDLDGDGVLDLARRAPDGLVFQRGLGDGRFAPRDLFWPSATLDLVLTLDLEGDGHRDLLVNLNDGVVPAPRAPQRHRARGR